MARARHVDEGLADLGAHVPDPDAVRRAFDAALAARPHGGPKVWLHGDLHPDNVLVDAGRLVGVIDFGDLTGGDPATDLASAWLLFDPATADDVLGAYGDVDADLEARARGGPCSSGSSSPPRGSRVAIRLRDRRPPRRSRWS